ncbi:MAG: hypothetical protein WC291_03145 [Thermodesulfovibrionales bacterium]|jgi:hypothetical protein
MRDIAIVIAEKEGGLEAVLEDSGYSIIPGTVRQFTSLTTFSDNTSKVFGTIKTGESGWIALAEYA